MTAEYKKLSKLKLAPWKQAAAVDKERYTSEMKSYKPPADLEDSDSDSDDDSAPKKKEKKSGVNKSEGTKKSSGAAKSKAKGEGKGAKKKDSVNSSSRGSAGEKKKPGGGALRANNSLGNELCLCLLLPCDAPVLGKKPAQRGYPAAINTSENTNIAFHIEANIERRICRTLRI